MVPPLVDRKYSGHSKWFELVSVTEWLPLPLSDVNLMSSKLWIKLNTSFKPYDVVASGAGPGTILKKTCRGWFPMQRWPDIVS